METNVIVDGKPVDWKNNDSINGKIKGTRDNCVLIALSDSGALDTGFWLSCIADAPGVSVKDFAQRHPKGSFLVSHFYPDSPPEILPLYWKGNSHYSALVNGILHNASASAVDNKVDYAFEVLHKKDIEARGIDLDAAPIAIPDGTNLASL